MQVSQLVDDLDGTTEDVATREFGLDGKLYEIDLSKENWDLLVEELQTFVTKGRLIKNTRLSPSLAYRQMIKGPGSKARMAEETSKNRLIREWGRNNGWPELSNRGRISEKLRRSYYASMQQVDLPEDE